jgi:hypothetical protein
MNKWGKSILALAVLAVVAAFGHLHSLSHSTGNSAALKPIISSQNKKLTKVTPAPAAPPTKTDSKIVQEMLSVPFASVTQNDPSAETGTNSVIVQGVNGVKIITYKIIYTGGIESSRQKISETVTTQPVNQITRVGTKPSWQSNDSDKSGPAGATAVCIDGTLSYALHHEGACSHHGGVNLWY